MNYGNKENMFMKPQVKKELMRMPMLTCDPCKMRFNSESEYIVHVKVVHMMLAIKPEPVYDHKPETILDKPEHVFDREPERIPDKPEPVLDRQPEAIPDFSQFQAFGATNIPNQENDQRIFGNDNILTLKKHYKIKRECPSCNVEFYREDILKTHMCINGQETKHRCNICWRPFTHKGNAENHVLVKHNKVVEKKYKCSICPKAYAQQSNLDNHFKVVHQNFRFKCLDCTNEYSSKATLDVHVKSKHRGVKFDCKHCEASFSYKHEFVQHVRSKHEGVTYQCTQCFDTFMYKQSLKNHVKAKHEKTKDLKCKYCNMTFSLYSSLYMHKKRKHEAEWNSDRNVSERYVIPASVLATLNSASLPMISTNQIASLAEIPDNSMAPTQINGKVTTVAHGTSFMSSTTVPTAPMTGTVSFL